ncbi:hypothetical protein AUQ48_02520 [Kocuria flava]|uniref:Uncharacterized protein n=1 Tax=Kocuria flava TaxID=446860 RepID=A0A2N4SZH0_9MICC|nr:hypothetical protein [Kocuria flava]PLC11329.1 hypothetical protein AUQ48_02520 [Kocuria flava]
MQGQRTDRGEQQGENRTEKTSLPLCVPISGEPMEAVSRPKNAMATSWAGRLNRMLAGCGPSSVDMPVDDAASSMASDGEPLSEESATPTASSSSRTVALRNIAA